MMGIIDRKVTIKQNRIFHGKPANCNDGITYLKNGERYNLMKPCKPMMTMVPVERMTSTRDRILSNNFEREIKIIIPTNAVG